MEFETIAIFLETFPVLSETFILNQIIGLIALGHEVHIHARRPGQATGDVHENISRYRILNHVHYDEPIPISELSAFQPLLFERLTGDGGPLRPLWIA